MFHQPTEEEYTKRLECYRQTWDAQFEDYYMRTIHPQIPHHIGRWVLEKQGCYNPYSGVTNNQSEALNRVIKDLQDWKEAPVDSMVLALHQLQAYYLNEIKRGLSGMGEYHLKAAYSSLAVNPHAIEYLPTYSPQEIVMQIRECGIKQDQTSEPSVRVKEETKESRGMCGWYNFT